MGLLLSCTSRRNVSGTLDGPLSLEGAPSQVLEAIDGAELLHTYDILFDEADGVFVKAVGEADTTSTLGWGFVVVKGGTSTIFPDLRNSRSPMASYDKGQDILWLTSSAIEGSGVHVDYLHEIRFDGNGKARIARTVDPYDIQSELLPRLGYSIHEEEVTLWDGGRRIASAINTLTDMGGFDSETPVWIGEQIAYDLSGDSPRLLVTPGIKYTTGLVLTYDDMPTLSAPLSIGQDGNLLIGNLH